MGASVSRILGLRLQGKPRGWASSKGMPFASLPRAEADVDKISSSNLTSLVSGSGGKGKVVELFRPGTETLVATSMANVDYMNADIGATSCVFPYSEAMGRCLEAHRGLVLPKVPTQTETCRLPTRAVSLLTISD
jgi:aconitate hydratase